MSKGLLSEYFERHAQNKNGTITIEWLNTYTGASYSTTSIQFYRSSPLEEEWKAIQNHYSNWYDVAVASRSTNTPNSGPCAKNPTPT